MVNFICFVIVDALAATFCLILARKWGWLEWLQVHAPTEFLSKLLNCNFCTSWWVCLAISLILSVAMKDYTLLLVAPLATPITARLW